MPVLLYANCIPIKGYTRSIILDLQRSCYHFIPNDLFEILIQYNGKPISLIKSVYHNKYDNIIDEYFEYLLNNEFAFKTSTPKLFPSLKLVWENSSIVTNSIICDCNSGHNYNRIFDELDQLSCKAIELRFFALKKIRDLYKILKFTEDKSFSHIDIIIPWIGELPIDEYRKIIHMYPRIWTFRVFNAPFTKNEFLDEQKQHSILFSTINVTDHSFCGFVHPNNFIKNINFFTESIHYNTCLNCKVCIDEFGNIKNCPSLEKIYGNINKATIKDVVSSDEFQFIWKVNKDDIEVCKNCEFRYICMDCRAYIKDKNNIYSQPVKCNYNPYIAKWKGQDGYISVEDWLNQN